MKPGHVMFVRKSALALITFILFANIPLSASAADEDPWQLWKQPGVHALMRHAIAPGTGDPAHFRLGDCNTQRNLDQTGRDQARRTGDRIREMGVEIDLALTSQWCRCVDTATLLGFSNVEEEPALNSFFSDRSTEPDQTQQTIKRLANLPDSTNAILVTHQVNITALTGIYPRSGEIILIRLGKNGELQTLGRLMP